MEQWHVALRAALPDAQIGRLGDDGRDTAATCDVLVATRHSAAAHKPIKSLTAAAAPLMLDLVQRALQSCHLTVFYAGRVMVVGEVDSPDRYAFGMKVGALVGLTDTASGYVLLAFQDDNTRRAMLASHEEVEGEIDVDAAQLARECPQPVS